MTVRSGLYLVLVLAMVASGCSSTGGDTASPQSIEQADGGNDGDQADVDAADSPGGLTSNDDAPQSLIEDFPVEIPGGWVVDIHGEIGMTNTNGAQLLYPADAFDSLVAFYDEWTESQADEYARTKVGEQVIYTGTESSVSTISITANQQERDQTWTLLQVFASDE